MSSMTPGSGSRGPWNESEETGARPARGSARPAAEESVRAESPTRPAPGTESRERPAPARPQATTPTTPRKDTGRKGKGKGTAAASKATSEDGTPHNWGAFRAAIALYGLVIMVYGAWQVLAGVNSLPETGSQVAPTVAASYGGLAAVLIGVGAAFLAIAIKFQWANVLGFVCFTVFLGGIGRILSWAFFGLPHWSMIVVMVLDLVIPPCLLVWYGWITKANSIRREMASGRAEPSRRSR